MSNSVSISGFASIAVASSAENNFVNKSNRKLMRFARKSGQMSLLTLIDALTMSKLDLADIAPERRALLFSDFLNLVPDVEKTMEVLLAITDGGKAYEKANFVKNVSDNWSVIEVLKNVPNIPAFIASQEFGVKGVTTTELSSCAGGLLCLESGYNLIRSGQAEVAFVSASSAKLNSIELPFFNQLGFYNDGDFNLLNGAAALILESEEHVKARNGKIYAKISGCQTSFSPKTYSDHVFDPGSIAFMLDTFSQPPYVCEDYVVGSFSKKLLASEINLVSGYNFNILESSSFKCQKGYSFAASGFMEIISLIRSGFSKGTIVNSFGFGGQNASIAVYPNNMEV